MTRRNTADAGFSLVELVIAAGVFLAIAGGLLLVVGPAQMLFEAELDRVDLQQRLRTSTALLMSELLMAGSGGQTPGIAPFRRGEVAPDPSGSAFADRISTRFIRPDAAIGAVETATYWLKAGGADGAQLMRYDGGKGDFPIADHVMGLRFDYYSDGATAIPLAALSDGPWKTDEAGALFDADLLTVRLVRVTLRIGSTRQMLTTPWRDVSFEVAPRNLILK